MTLKTFTVFVRDADEECGTTWIDTVQAEDVDDARAKAVIACAEEWDYVGDSADPQMRAFQCPQGPSEDGSSDDPILGCGAVFNADPDDEGLVDCPDCGMWFSAAEVRP